MRRHHRARRLRRPRHRGHDPGRPATPARTTSPTSASAWACRSRSWSLPATCWAAPTPTPASSTPDGQHHGHRPDGRPEGQHPPRAAPCAWATTPAAVEPGTKLAECYGETGDLGAPPPPLRVQQRLPQRAGRTPVWSCPAPAPTAVWWRPWSCRAPVLPCGRAVPPGVQEPPQPRTSPVQGLHRSSSPVPCRRAAQHDECVIPSPSAAQTAPPEGEPLAGRATPADC